MTKLNSCLREASSHQNVGNSIDFPNSQNSWPKFQFMKPWFSKNSSNLVEPGFLNKETNIYSPANIRVLRRAIPTSPTSFTSTPHLDFSTQGESGKIWGRKTLSLGYSFFLSKFGWLWLKCQRQSEWQSVWDWMLSQAVCGRGCREYAIWATEHYSATKRLFQLQSYSATNPYIQANDGRQPQGANGATI